MNGYIAFFGSKQIEIYAKDLWEAKQQAITAFKVPKSKQHMVSVLLAEKDGHSVVHTPDF